MNKNGFTLIELLAVIALVAILSSIAVPNVLSSINNSRKNSFLLDAKRMVSKAESLVSNNRVQREEIKSGIPSTYNFSDLNEKNEFSNDPDGGIYSDDTYVKVSYDTSNMKYLYCIYVSGSKRKIASDTGNCIDSTLLSSIDIIKDK